MRSCLRLSSVGVRVVGALLVLLGSASLAGAFVNFESGHVRPLALSPDGNRLFAVNTPDNRLEIYDITGGGLTLAAEVPVGLEPVAVATRTNTGGRTEAWVVNHLSDSISIVEIDPGTVALSRVTRTLLVGDEPRDIVFAGPGRNRAFITCARRGQNRFPTTPDTGPQLTTQGVGRADVWSFDANALGAALGGTPLSIVQLFGDTPRALTVSTDGSTVFAAIMLSGNRTTTLFEGTVNGNGPPPPPGATPNAPSTGLIVKFDTATNTWKDERPASNWNGSVPFTLPDRDVFLINANATPPALAAGTNFVTGVGTVLFNMAVRPTNGKVYVSNTDAQNAIRFEPTIHGHIAENRITVISGTTPTARHLNPQINYAVTPGPQSEIDQSLAFPMDMTFSADGNTLFVVGFGSGKVGVFDANALEAGTINGSTKSLVTVGGGPSGIVLDAARDRLYVMNRFDHTISIVGNASQPSRVQTGVVPLRFDPSPPPAKDGRRFLYDAQLTSGHGDSACASCHTFGDFDSIAWDLGDPFGTVLPNLNPFRVPVGNPVFHPMKGPMTTQSLRGMAPAGPMHWRGDRTGSTTGGDALDETLAFKAFNPAFVGLLGRSAQLTNAEMQAFTDFILTVKYPPNPIRALNDAPTTAQNAGATFFVTTPVDAGVITCSFCHALPLGTDGFSSFEGEPQEFKIAHLRNAYQKVGMFFSAGNQIRGAGFLHDGSVATVFNFLQGGVFQFPNGNTDRRNLEAFIMAFDTGQKPAVGQQVTVTPSTVNDATVTGRIDLLIARDDAGDCELVVKGNIGGAARGAVYVGGNNFQPDRNLDPLIGKTALRALAGTAGQEQVYTCVPVGEGVRIGVDRDLDGFFDRTEIDAATDPADPLSSPAPVTTSTTSSTSTSTSSTTSTTAPAVLISTRSLTLRDDNVFPPDPTRRKVQFKSDTRFDTTHIVPPQPQTGSDPTINGATLRVYNSAGLSSDDVLVSLPAGPRWTILGSHTFGGYRYKDPDPNAAITKVEVKPDKITIKGGKALWQYTLDEAQQGRVAVRVTLGLSQVWCADAPAKVSGNPPSTLNNDKVDKFTAEPKSPAPGSCPVVGSPSGAFLDQEADPFD